MDKMLSRQQVEDPYNHETDAKLHMAQMHQEKTPYTVEILGVPIEVHKNVFSPKFSGDTKFFIEKMISPKGKKVLEVGTGTGAIAVFCAMRGAITVHAVDINKSAVANAQENLNKHGFVGPHYTAYYSDLFNNINEKFDIIYLNPPWLPGKPEDDFEKAELDEDYCTIKRFMAKVGDYLESDGSVCLSWSDWSDMALLKDLIEKNGFQIHEFYEEFQILAGDESITSFVIVLKLN